MAVGNTKVVQVTNIAPQATKDQMHVLFGYLGKIEDIRLYPTVRDVSIPVQSRICYVKFTDTTTVGIAQHMTNTVFIDRALIVIPVQNGEIPDEYYALEMTRNGTLVPGLNVNEPKLPIHVVNSIQGSGADQMILTIDPTLETNDLPNYPPLPSSAFDSAKVEETRRTILVENISTEITSDEWIQYFNKAGEIKYMRTCTRTTDSSLNLLVEFSDQSSIINALKMSGAEFKGRILQIQHATQPINKPQAKSNEAAQKEIEEALTRFKEAQNMINASIEPVIGMLTKDNNKKSSRRSRSRSPRSPRDRKRNRRSSRSRSRRRSRSSRRRRTSRSRSRGERRRRSRSRRRTRSRSTKRRSVSRTRKTSRSRSRKRSKSRENKKSSAQKLRDRSKDRKRSSRDRSKERERSKDRKTKEKTSLDVKYERDDVQMRSKTKSRSRSRKRSRSPAPTQRTSLDKRRGERKRSRSRGNRRRTPTSARKRTSRSKSRDNNSSVKKKDRKDKTTTTKNKSRSRSRTSTNKRSNKSRSKSRNRSKDDNKIQPQVDIKIMEEIEKESAGEKSDNMDISNSP